MNRPLIQMVSDVVLAKEDECACRLSMELTWLKPEVARLEARVVRLAELLERAEVNVARRRYTLRWDAMVPARRAVMLRREICAAVNKLREARGAT